MRVLLASSPSEGLFYSLVPLAWALRSRGHQVLVGAPENMATVVASAGLPFAAAAPPLNVATVMNTDREGIPIPRPDTEEELLAHIGRGFGKLSRLSLPGLDSLVEEWRPDVIVAEHHEYASAIAATRRGLPRVVHPVALASPPVIDEVGVAELAPELAERGLTTLDDPALVLTCCPDSVGTPETRAATPMRYIEYNTQAELPPTALSEKRRPRVLLSLGTRVPRVLGVPFLRSLVDSVADVCGELLVATPADLATELGTLPANVLAGWLPVDEVVPSCDLALHQAGSNTVMTSLLAGVPQILLPYIAEQRDMARRLERAGVAQVVEPGAETPELLRRTCQEMIGDESYLRRIRTLATEFTAMPTPAAVVPAIEQLCLEPAR